MDEKKYNFVCLEHVTGKPIKKALMTLDFAKHINEGYRRGNIKYSWVLDNYNENLGIFVNMHDLIKVGLA